MNRRRKIGVDFSDECFSYRLQYFIALDVNTDYYHYFFIILFFALLLVTFNIVTGGHVASLSAYRCCTRIYALVIPYYMIQSWKQDQNIKIKTMQLTARMHNRKDSSVATRMLVINKMPCYRRENRAMPLLVSTQRQRFLLQSTGFLHRLASMTVQILIVHIVRWFLRATAYML